MSLGITPNRNYSKRNSLFDFSKLHRSKIEYN